MSKSKTKIGIYLCAILMMGVIAVSSNLANIMAAFPDTNPNTIVSYMISVPCFVIIIMSLVTGKLMDIFSKRNLMIFGILCWLIGGTVPYFMSSLGAMVIMRAVFGVGCGMVMSLCSALVAENFEDPVERGKVQGTMTSFQMLGAIFFSIVAGNLGSIGWNVAFLVHLMAIVSLIACIACIPNVKPAGKVEGVEKPKFQPTGMLWVWVIAFIIFMFAGQEYSNAASTLITEAGLGGSAAAGYSLALFAFGGFCMGFIFGKIAKVCGRFTLTVGCLLLALSYVIMAFAASLPVILHLHALHYYRRCRLCGHGICWHGSCSGYLRPEPGTDPVLLCHPASGQRMGCLRQWPDRQPVRYACRRNYHRCLCDRIHLPEQAEEGVSLLGKRML